MKIAAAAIQMPSEPAERRRQPRPGRRPAPPGASRPAPSWPSCPRCSTRATASAPTTAPTAKGLDGPTLTHLRRRSRQWGMAIAAGFVERDGRHLYDALAFVTPDGEVHVYRKRNLVFWERSRFQPGRAPLVVADALGPDRVRGLRRHDLPEGLARLPRPDRPGGRRRGLARLRRPRDRAGSTGCSATSGRSRGRSPAGSRATWASRSSSPTSAARPGRRSRCSAPTSPTGSPARAASATAGTAPPSARGSTKRSS